MALNSVEASVLSQCPSLYPSSFVSCVNEGVSWLASHNGITYYTSIMVATDATVTSKSGSLVRIGLIDIDRPLSGLVYYEVLSIAESVDSVSSATVYKVKLKYKSPLGIEISLYPFTYYNATLNSDSYYTATEVDAKIEELQSTITELKEAISNISSSGSADIDLSKYVTNDTLSTTLEGYITSDVLNTSLKNYYTKEEVDTKLSEINVSEDTGSDEESGSTDGDSTEAGSMEGQINYEALIAILNTKANAEDVYTKDEVNSSLELKANVSDVYTKAEVDAKLEELTVESGDSESNEGSDEESDSVEAGTVDSKINYEALIAILNTKANAEDVYSKEEADKLFVTKEEFESKISELESAEEDEVTDGDSVEAGKVDSQINYEALVAILDKKANVDDVYTKSEVDETLENYYTKEEVDSLLENVDSGEDVDQPEVDEGNEGETEEPDTPDVEEPDTGDVEEPDVTEPEEGEEDASTPAQPMEPVAVSIDLTSTDEPYTMSLNVAEGYSLNIEVENEEIATASYEDGVITFNALSNGTTTATITISKEGEEDKVITVNIVVELEEESSGDESEGEEDSNIPADEMTPEVKTILLTSVEEPYVLNLNVPEGYELSVSTGDPEVATAEYSDGSITVTAVNNGQTTLDIVVKKDDEEQTISINIVVVLDTTPDDSDESGSESEGDGEDGGEEETPDESEPEVTDPEEGDSEDGEPETGENGDGETEEPDVTEPEEGEEDSQPAEGMEPQVKTIELTSKSEPYSFALTVDEGYSLSITVADEAVATAVYEDGTVIIAPVANGETTVTLTASKEGEEDQVVTFKVVVKLEESDSNEGEPEDGEGDDSEEEQPAVDTEITGIEVIENPEKLEYYLGESFDSTGMVVHATYSDGSSEEITDYTVAPETFEEEGDIVVSITYGEFETSIIVTVMDSTVDKNFGVEGPSVEKSSMSVKTQPDKTEYFIGESFDSTGMVLEIVYSDESTAEVTSGFTFTPEVFEEAGDEIAVTITYEDISTTFNVKVQEVVAESIAIETEPTKVAYFVGDTVDLSGLTLKITYNSGKEEIVEEGYTYDAITLDTEGNHTITVTYGEFTVDVVVVAYETTLESLTVTAQPDKTEYYVGDKIDYTGLVVEGTFSNGKTIEMEEYNVSPEVFENAGEIEVTISVGDISTSFKVTVIEVVMTSIDITNPMSQTLYYVGDKINTDGLEITATYNNGSKVVVEDYEITPKTFDSEGEVEVTVTVGEFSVKFSVEVIEEEVGEVIEMDPQTDSISLIQEGQTYTINVNLARRYTLTAVAADKTVAIAQYQDGVVTILAVNNGETTVTLTASKEGSEDVTVSIAVVVDIPSTSISLDYTEVAVHEGNSVSVGYTTDEGAEVSVSTNPDGIVEAQIEQ